MQNVFGEFLFRSKENNQEFPERVYGKFLSKHSAHEQSSSYEYCPLWILQPAYAPLESSSVQTETVGKFTGSVYGKVPVQCILKHTCR